MRVIDAFVEAIDLGELGFDGVVPAATGLPSDRPSVLLKLYSYGYLNRVQSSRRLERQAGRNVEVMWLTAGSSPITRPSRASGTTMAAPSVHEYGEWDDRAGFPVPARSLPAVRALIRRASASAPARVRSGGLGSNPGRLGKQRRGSALAAVALDRAQRVVVALPGCGWRRRRLPGLPDSRDRRHRALDALIGHQPGDRQLETSKTWARGV